ncbi:LolA family protein [Candidatus Cardinium hertigii]|uniref:LolA family protein n=1 Tax=Candidatus Cardinium hertigii TaxID=247481 RepID=UPI003D7CAF98
MQITKRYHFLVVQLCRSLLACFISIVPIFAAVDEKAVEILDKTSAYYQSLENFSATYNLTIQYPEEDTIRHAKMCITARGPQYRLSYDQKETITDGETVWVYDKALKEVTISEYAKTDSDLNFAELYNIYQEGYLSVYIGERIVHKAKNIMRDIVQLTPLHEDSSCKSITLEIDRTTTQIHRWEVVQNEETRYICTVCSFSVNIPLSDTYFTFDMDAHGDLEIIDLRENEEEMDIDEM